MSDAYKQMMAKINREAKKYKECKKSVAKRDIRTLLLEFINNLDKARDANQQGITLAMTLESEIDRLTFRFKQIDPYVQVDIVWHNEDAAESVGDLSVVGFHIWWSDKYRAANKDCPEEERINVDQLFLEGLFED